MAGGVPDESQKLNPFSRNSLSAASTAAVPNTLYEGVAGVGDILTSGNYLNNSQVA